MALTDIFSLKGGLEKLKITSFEDDMYETATATYVVMYNPTTFNRTFSSHWIPEEGTNQDAKQYQYRALESDEISFEFLFDATGASPPGKDVPGGVNLDYLGDESINKDLISDNKKNAIEIINDDKHVDRAIKEFLDITHYVKSETHTPGYLQINWGAFEFRGVLKSATVNYKLFNSSGLPIRATVNADFVESLSREEQAEEKRLQSADLTHRRTVKAGDTLALISKKVYDDPAFYIEIAKVNNLNNFRNLKMGQQLVLPPIKK